MNLPNFSLEGKVAIVTGGSRGIGKAIALAFAAAGADLAICSRTLSDLERTAEEIRGLGHKVLAVPADITKRNEVENLVKRTVEELGTVDILVNNAAIGSSGVTLLETSDEDWDKVVETDLKGYQICTRTAAKVMVGKKGGNIINVASALAFVAMSGRGVYSVCKAGIVHYTRLLAVELGPYNIRVNCIAPGLTKTTISPRSSDPEYVRKRISETPLRRIGVPEDHAGAALFFASDASSWTTGQTLIIDGGRGLG